MTRTVAVLGFLLIAVTACQSPIRSGDLDGSVRTTFTHLYVLDQEQRGLEVTPSGLHTAVRCGRDNRAQPRSGPGDDWVCNITWRTPAATTAGATYAVTVKADGCFTADGDGPSDLVGSQTLVDVDGQTVLNPLWAFHGCLDLS